jgi:3-oxoacyl-[acyl-carrier protein] reductase
MDLGLTGKVAMVASASKGLGFGVARVLAAEGALVSIASRSPDAVEESAVRIAAETGARTLATPVDVQSGDQLAAWHARTVEKFGGVDLLFVNTGGPPAGQALSFDDAAWQSAFELLVLSAVRIVRLAVPSMKARGGGAIVMSTSSAVKEPIANLALSNVIRASVAALSKTLANELAADRIRVNHLMPGRINTDRVRHLDALKSKNTGQSVDDVRAAFERSVPLGRYGEPYEYGHAAAFLLSDAARYITGASLQVDGGLIRGVL